MVVNLTLWCPRCSSSDLNAHVYAQISRAGTVTRGHKSCNVEGRGVAQKMMEMRGRERERERERKRERRKTNRERKRERSAS